MPSRLQLARRLREEADAVLSSCPPRLMFHSCCPQEIHSAVWKGHLSPGDLLQAIFMSVAPGYFADIVAVDDDPLIDIDVVLSKVRWVMKGCPSPIFIDGQNH